MTLARLVRRNLTYYWRGNLAVVAGVAIAVAVLSGALLVGDSVRGSLRDLTLRRLGATGSIVVSTHLFRDRLASDISARFPAQPPLCPILHARGVAWVEKSGRRALGVDIYGIDDRFWRFHGIPGLYGPEGRDAFIGDRLSHELQAVAGDAVLVRVQKDQAAPQESFLGRRDEPGSTLRLSCSRVLGDGELAAFSVQPGTRGLTLFLPLVRLQRELASPESANTLLAAPGLAARDLRSALASAWTPEDAGIAIRAVPAEGAISVESSTVLLPDAVARAALAAAARSGMPASPVYTYLATSIRCGEREIPYAVVSAADLDGGALAQVPKVPAQGTPPAAGDALWLNEWAANELRPQSGEPIDLSYFVWRNEGRLDTAATRFRFAGTVRTGAQAGPSLAPDFPGITKADSLAEWDPPFPFDLRRIRPADEKYWDEFRTTPKAFIPLERGRSLWGTRFGTATSVRLRPAEAEAADPADVARGYAASLRWFLEPEAAGLTVVDIRGRSLDASLGSTDFGEYFLYFSFFLIAAALLLSALFFRFGIEQRVREVGTLAAAGFAVPRVRAILLLEASALTGAGAVAGLPAAAGYAALMMHGLSAWWTGATGNTPLTVHLSALSLGAGAALGIASALLATVLTLRGLARSSPRALLAGILEAPALGAVRARQWRAVCLVSTAAAFGAMVAARLGAIPQEAGFFGAGALLLVGALSATSLYFRRRPNASASWGRPAPFRLGSRNAGYRPGRSLACVALIAGATFVIVSLEAFRQGSVDAEGRQSGTGGFALTADFTLPVLQDLNDAAGRDALGLGNDAGAFRDVRFVPFRVKAGDDASCLNLYAPQQPRVLGVPRGLIEEGRFRFQSLSEPADDAARRNPWLLLEASRSDGAVPAIADANTIRYVLHLSPGDELLVPGAGGIPVRLRLVAALRDSLFQSDILISESNFLKHFPGEQGFRFYLIDADRSRASEVARRLDEGLADWGFDVRPASERLAEFHRVENAYLSTFQSLGGLGLLLGTAGMAAVLLRNVLERRKELALLRAVGFPRFTLVATVVAENAILVGLGLAAGAGAALIAVVPALLSRASPFPLAAVLALIGSVFLVGLGASGLAAAAAFRAPLLAALRSE